MYAFIEGIVCEKSTGGLVLQTGGVGYQLISDRLELPVDEFVPGFGWGLMYADIVE